MEIKLDLNEGEAQQLKNLFNYWAEIAHELLDINTANWIDEDLPGESLCVNLENQMKAQIPIECNCDDDCNGENCGCMCVECHNPEGYDER